LSDRLYIQLGRAEQDAVNWQLWRSKHSEPLERGELEQAQLAALAGQYPQAEAVLIVPSEEVRAISVELPSTSRSARQAIPFLIEERVSSSLEALHIVSGTQVTKQVESWVVERERMDSWLQLADEAGFTLTQLVPEFALLPREKAHQGGWFDGQRLLLNCEAFQGALPQIAVAGFMANQSDNNALLVQAYQRNTVSGCHNQETNEPLLTWLARQGERKRPALNLLSSDYAQAGGWQSQWRSFLWPGGLLLALAVCYLAAIGIENYRLAEKNRQLDQQMEQVYRQVFPEAKRVTDPARQLRAQLRAQQAGGSDSVFFDWLSLVAPRVQQQQLQLLNLRFNSSPLRLQLQLEGKNYNALETLLSQVNQAAQGSFTAQIGTLQQCKAGVSGLLTLQ